MSATRDPIGISSIGIQSVMPSQKPSRVYKRKPQDDQDTEDARDHASPKPHPPGTGTLVDKEV
jgi:hypothetical protein